ncbi:MAG: hypothetical protein ACRCS0_15620 [Albidovulum sp.]
MSLSSIRLIVLEPGSNKLFTCDGNAENVEVLIDNVEKFPDGIVIDPSTGEIYGTLMGKVDPKDASAYGYDGEIWRLDHEGGDRRLLIGGGKIRTPKQIALDEVNRKLYWSDREGLRVMRSNLDGSEVETLVETGRLPDDEKDMTRWSVGIAVDPVKRQFYWTQKGHPDAGEGRICRAGYDLPLGETPATRSDIEVLFDNLPEPIDLDLDLEHGTLWWTDRGDLAGGNSVCRASIGPDRRVSARHQVAMTGLRETIGMVVLHDEGYIFTTSLTGEMFRARLDGSERVQIGKFGQLTGIARY